MAKVVNFYEERARRHGQEIIAKLNRLPFSELDKIPALAAAACRMLIKEIADGRARPRKLLLCYGADGHTESAPIVWRYLAFALAPDELRSMAEFVAADLEINPPPEPLDVS